LEEADVTEYERLGFKAPEVFVAKARDVVTDIWGIVSIAPYSDSYQQVILNS
jgi:hypothetical protein